MNYRSRVLCCISLAMAVLPSCQKVIELDLNSTDPVIVIEANVSNLPGPYSVELHKTVNFSDANIFPPCTGAAVTINDNAGNSELLTETTPGTYTTASLQGIVGRIYTISVTADGKNYQGVSNLPAPVTIDTLIVSTSTGFGPGGGGMGGNDSVKSISVHFTDPIGITNYYRLVEIVNGVRVNTFSITSDLYQDGFSMEETIRGGSDFELNTGDVVTIQLQSIDKNVYEYFRTFNETSGGGGFTSASPANPTSNISNGALGYFNAYSVTSKTIVIQ
ncbi:MAG: DUF4249 domain-containing protein [Bacteroidota bacterium]